MLEDVIEATEQRFRQRDQQRRGAKRHLERSDVLGANESSRVERRLRRMGVSEPATRAIIGKESIGEVVKANHLGEKLAAFETLNLGLERILGDNDLIGVSFLERGWQAAKSVGCIADSRTKRGFGTGFLVSSRLLMTNNHVLSHGDDAAQSVVMFDYQVDASGKALTPAVFQLDPATLFLTDRELDYALVAVEPQSDDGRDLDDFGHLRLEDEEVFLRGILVNIIQHPNGERKQLALRENMVIDVLDRFVHYQTDTAPGSSGSPVFNDEWEVVCLHHSGVPKRNEKKQILARDGTVWKKQMGESAIAWEANEGVIIGEILKDLKRNRSGITSVAQKLLESIASRPGPTSPVAESDQMPLSPDPSLGYQLHVPLEIVINVHPARIVAQVKSPRES